MFITTLFLSIICSLRGIIASIRPLCPAHDNLRGIITSICLLCPAHDNLRGITASICPLYPVHTINYYPCQGQLALSMPNFNEASLSDTLQLVYSYKILWETGSLIPFYIGHYYNNQSSHQWLLLLRKKLPISLI